MVAFATFAFYGAHAQEQHLLDGAQIHGNFDLYAQTYQEDSIIGAKDIPEKSGVNAFTNLIVTKGPFTAGIRVESYLPPVQGFDVRFGNQSVGVPYRFAQFSKDGLDITAGNFYEQFGSGMILRAYEERSLGIDNAFDGLRVKYSPYQGIYLKGLIGKQRYYWTKGDGTVRGIDGEVSFNELISKFEASKFRLTAGGSFVSKFQDAGVSSLDIPENVASFAGRMQMGYGGLSFTGEYVRKFNDPNGDNGFIYRDGQGLFLSATYSQKGFGINVSAKTIDNLGYRSDRNALLNDLFINYLPALTRQHTYTLASTLYPYATQPNGEIGIQTDIIYKIKKGSAIGGKYGTTIQINAALINGHDTNQISSATDLAQQVYLPNDPEREGYTTSLLSIGDKKYYQDFNIEIDRKFLKKYKMKFTYIYQEYNIDLIQGTATGHNVYAHIGVIEGLVKFTKKQSLRYELQHMFTEQDQGDWAFASLEYGYSPHWIVTVLNQYNYGNPVKKLQVHYPTVQVAYVHNANRIALSYGRQRAGIFCVGGVCRNVPAANGFTLAITSSF